MRFKVPQNVQREDTIIGPITMRQMIILSIGGGLAYSIFIILSKNYFIEVWIIPIVIIVAITLAFAFAKIHELTFLQYLLHFTEYLMSAKKRIWTQGAGEVQISQLTVLKKSKEEIQAEEKRDEDKEKTKDLNKLSELLDSHNKN